MLITSVFSSPRHNKSLLSTETFELDGSKIVFKTVIVLSHQSNVAQGNDCKLMDTNLTYISEKKNLNVTKGLYIYLG